MTAPATIRLHVEALDDPAAVRRGEPVTWGLPLPAWIAEGTTIAGVLEDARAGGMQTSVTELWSDRSVRWVVLNTRVERGTGIGALRIVRTRRRFVRTRPSPSPTEQRLRRCRSIRRRSGWPPVDRCCTRRAGPRRPRNSPCPRRTRTATHSVGQVRRCPRRIARPVAGVALSPRATGGGRSATVGGVLHRLHFFAGSPVVRTVVTVRDPRGASRPGGMWDLGDGNSILLKSLSLELRRKPGGRCSLSAEPGLPLRAPARRPASTRIPAAARTGTAATTGHAPGEDRDGVSRVSLGRRRAGRRPSTARAAGRRGGRDDRGGGSRVLAELPDVRGIDREGPGRRPVRPPGRRAAGAPARRAEDLGGPPRIRRRHRQRPADGLVSPADARPRRPAWYAEAEAWRYLTPKAADPNAAYLALVDAAVDGEDTFAKTRGRRRVRLATLRRPLRRPRRRLRRPGAARSLALQQPV